MKKLIIFTCLFAIGALNINAQSLSIKTIPYEMYFENTPVEYKVINDSHIQFSAGANTDLFYSPAGDYITNKSPRLLFKPDSGFTLSAKIGLEFKANWDAGDLIIYNDSRNWVKFCFERDFQGQARVVSVVCNNFADDCNSMAVKEKFVYYKIAGSLKDKKFGLYYSNNGEEWYPVRVFALAKTNNIRIGFCVQSPIGEGTTASFSEIKYKKKDITDWWKGE